MDMEFNQGHPPHSPSGQFYPNPQEYQDQQHQIPSSIMKSVSPLHASVSADSTLSTNDSLSAESASASSTNQHHLQTAAENGVGGAVRDNDVSRRYHRQQQHQQQHPTKPIIDRDMTEDEVAQMVKNALRKARKAMNNGASSSASDDDENIVSEQRDGSTTNDNETNSNLLSEKHEGGRHPSSYVFDGDDEDKFGGNNIPDEVSFGMSGEDGKFPLTSCDSEGMNGGIVSPSMTPTAEARAKDDLARRIEEEIRSARAFAERKYATGVGGSMASSSVHNMSSTPRGGGDSVGAGDITPRASPARMGRKTSSVRSSAISVDTQMTPMISNAADPSSPSRLLALSSVTTNNNNSSWRDSARKRMARNNNINSSVRAASGKEDDGGTYSNNSTPRATSPRLPTSPRLSKHSTLGGGENSISPRVEPINTLSKDPTIAEQEFSTSPTPNARNVSPFSSTSAFNPKSASLPPPGSTNPSKPTVARQVQFRHPYPLPPPPPMPRNDEMIIASNTPPEKEINVKWVQPDTDLEALIIAAGSEDNLVRRSNACGALKVLASKDSNKPKLCRTTGLLDGLVKASWEDAVDSDALDARTRAVTTLLALSEPKGNRQIMAKHPQLVELLIKVIKEDTGEARWRATSTLATLAKTPANRGGMGQIQELATVLGDLMVEGLEPTAKEKSKPTEKNNKGNLTTETEGDEKNGGEGGENANGTGSRDDYSSYYEGGQSTFDTLDDERLFTHTFSGTFTEGTGTTYTEDDYTYRSAYDSETNYSDENEEGRSRGSHDSFDYDEDCSIQDEEGVEMQISSLKKLNIENSADYLAKSQLSACAALSHLVKHCANAPILCKNDQLLKSILTVAAAIESPLHTRCLEILCNFTRFPSNNSRLAAKPECINALLLCCKSKIAEDRMWSVRTIQNLCSDASSKVGLATNSVLTALSTAAMRKDHDEQYAAVGALMNLSTEPGSIVPLTNTKTVVATLVHLAHSPNTSNAVRKLACDSLATIGLWLQTLASAGTVPPEIPFSPLPTHSAVGWLRWE